MTHSYKPNRAFSGDGLLVGGGAFARTPISGLLSETSQDGKLGLLGNADSTGFGGMFALGAALEKSLQIHWWQGRSGYWYPHSIVTNLDDLFETSAIYIMVRREPNRLATPLYIGKADDLRERFLSHEKRELARILGASELHIHLLARNEQELSAIEVDLIKAHSPVLNRQHNPAFMGM